MAFSTRKCYQKLPSPESRQGRKQNRDSRKTSCLPRVKTTLCYTRGQSAATLSEGRLQLSGAWPTAYSPWTRFAVRNTIRTEFFLEMNAHALQTF